MAHITIKINTSGAAFCGNSNKVVAEILLRHAHQFAECTGETDFSGPIFDSAGEFCGEIVIDTDD